MKSIVCRFPGGKAVICFTLVMVLLHLSIPGCAPAQTPAAAEPAPAAPEAEPTPVPAEETPAVSDDGAAEPIMLFPFRDVRWGMTPREVAAMEGREPVTSERGSGSGLLFELYDAADVLGIPMYFSYSFDDNDGLNSVYVADAAIPGIDEVDYEAAFELLCEHISEIYGSYVHRSSEPDGSRRYLFSEKEATLDLRLMGEPEDELSGRISIEYYPAPGFGPISLERYSLCPFAPVTWGVPLEYVILNMGREPEWYNVLDNGAAYLGYYYTIEMQGYELDICYGFDEQDQLVYLSATYGEYGEYSRDQFEECHRWFYDILASTYGEASDEGHDAEKQLQKAWFRRPGESCSLVLLDEGREDGLEFTGAFFYPDYEILEPQRFPVIAAFHGMSPEDMIAIEGREPDEQRRHSEGEPEGFTYYYGDSFTDNVIAMRAYGFDERDRLMEALLTFQSEEDSGADLEEDLEMAFDEIFIELCRFYGEPYFPPLPEGYDMLVATFTGSGFMVQLVCENESPDAVTVYFRPLNEFEYAGSE